jgi:sugar-specific transcriptional regulator TrmB
VIEGLNDRTLVQIGFTFNQAKLYLALLDSGRMNAREVAKHSKVPRQEVYRVLDELREMGLIEKIMGIPCAYEAVPINEGLQIMIAQREQRFKEIQEKTKEILRQNQICLLPNPQKQNNEIIMIEGRQRLMQIIKHEHDSAEKKVNILTTLNRWLQILDFSFRNYCKALKRGVKYQVVIEKLPGKINLQENVKALLSKRNFQLRYITGPLKTNAAVFDGKEATINLFPGKTLAESPMLLTNHPSLIQMCEDHFESIWKSAKKYTITET